MRNKKAEKGELPEEQKIKKKCSPTWAMLIKMIYEVDPLKCPRCGEEMKIVSFIEAKHQSDVIKRILKHCGLWKDNIPRPPPKIEKPLQIVYDEPQIDYTFFTIKNGTLR